MLVPLYVPFGWPKPPPVTPLEALGLLVGVPLVVIIIAFAVAKGHAVMQTSKVGPGPHPGDPVWAGGRAKSIMGGAEDLLPEVGAEERRQIASTPTTATAEAGTGGASARW